MEARHKVIDISVQLEYNISMFLSAWLGIDRDSSRSLGSKSSSLSFNQQVNLILDMKILNKQQTQKLECFAQIRNKFAHVLEIKNFNDCFNSNSSLRNTMNKLYPLTNNDVEEFAGNMQLIGLLHDIVLIGDAIILKLKEHLKK